MWNSQKRRAEQWADRLSRALPTMDDPIVERLTGTITALVRTVTDYSQSESALRDLVNQSQTFDLMIPELVYSSLEAQGILTLGQQEFIDRRNEALSAMDARAREIMDSLHNAAENAVAQVNLARREAREIVLKDADDQFETAAKGFLGRAWTWGRMSAGFFIWLVVCLFVYVHYPPDIVTRLLGLLEPGSKQPWSAPTSYVVIASAYFTSIRLAFLGLLSLGLAFSLRMTRAYLHLIEHNRHKQRVAKSIASFVGAVLSEDRKDLIVSKLVDAVTEFGDPGILTKQPEGSALPSVFVEAITKSFGKSDQKD